MTEYQKQKNIAKSQSLFDEAMRLYKTNYERQLKTLKSSFEKEKDPKKRAELQRAISEVSEKLDYVPNMSMYDVDGAEPEINRWTNIGMDASNSANDWMNAIEKTVNKKMTKTFTTESAAPSGPGAGAMTGAPREVKHVIKPTTRLEDFEDEPIEDPAPEPAPTPQAQPQQAPSQRLTTDTTPAEFKPALMEKEKAKTEEEYLGKDRSKWANMSTADKVAGLAGLLGDAGGDIVDIVAAAHGIENGGAERLKKRRDEINQRREERKKEYQEYLNRVDDINRQIAMHNNNTINNSAMAKFNADNAYRMINYQARQQAAAQAAAGLYM